MSAKDFNSNTFDNEEPSAYPRHSTNAYLQNEPNDGQYAERAKWTDEDLDAIFSWFQEASNVHLYNFGVKAKAIRSLSEFLGDKSSRQIYNKLNALESAYHSTKKQLKHGIPLTDRDIASGVDTAQAKVKSLFKYYYEMDHILSGVNFNENAQNNSNGGEKNPYNNSARDTPQFDTHDNFQQDTANLGNNNRPGLSEHDADNFNQEKAETYGQAQYDEQAQTSPSARFIDNIEAPAPQVRRRGRRSNTAFLQGSSVFNISTNENNGANESGKGNEREKKSFSSLTPQEKRERWERKMKHSEAKLEQRIKEHKELMSMSQKQLDSQKESLALKRKQHDDWVTLGKIEKENRRLELNLTRIRLEKEFGITVPETVVEASSFYQVPPPIAEHPSVSEPSIADFNEQPNKAQ